MPEGILTLLVCDVCATTSHGRTWTIGCEDRIRVIDLCPAHAGQLKEMLALGRLRAES